MNVSSWLLNKSQMREEGGDLKKKKNIKKKNK